jgi:hypothetical protein
LKLAGSQADSAQLDASSNHSAWEALVFVRHWIPTGHQLAHV